MNRRPAIWRPGDLETWRPGDLETVPSTGLFQYFAIDIPAK
jgi:hypothetical protein